MIQTLLEFLVTKSHNSTPTAARKSKQIVKLLNLLASNQRSLVETISSFAYIVGGPVGRGKKGKKNQEESFHSDLSISLWNSLPDCIPGELFWQSDPSGSPTEAPSNFMWISIKLMNFYTNPGCGSIFGPLVLWSDHILLSDPMQPAGELWPTSSVGSRY